MEGVQLSAPQYVQNLPWNIMAERQPKQSHPESYLGFFLECNKESESTSWNCYAEVELRLLSCKPGQNFSRSKYVFILFTLFNVQKIKFHLSGKNLFKGLHYFDRKKKYYFSRNFIERIF